MLKGLLTGLGCNRYYDRKDWEPHKSRSPSVRSWELVKKEHCEGTHEGLTISKTWRPRARDGMVIIVVTTSCSHLISISRVYQSKLCDSKRRICYWSVFFPFGCAGGCAGESRWEPELQRVHHLQPSVSVSWSIFTWASIQPRPQRGQDHTHQ